MSTASEVKKSAIIRAQLREMGLTQAWLAEKLGISVCTLNQSINNVTKWGRKYRRARGVLRAAKSCAEMVNAAEKIENAPETESMRISETSTDNNNTQEATIMNTLDLFEEFEGLTGIKRNLRVTKDGGRFSAFTADFGRDRSWNVEAGRNSETLYLRLDYLKNTPKLLINSTAGRGVEIWVDGDEIENAVQALKYALYILEEQGNKE